MSYIFEDAEYSGVGAVLFDLKEQEDGQLRPALGAGWASLNGGKAFRIQSYEELDSNVIWICNLDRQTFWMAGCARIKRLKESIFFKTEMGALMRELGLVPKKNGPTYVVERLSSIYAHAFLLIKNHYKCEFKDSELVDSLKRMLIPEDAPLGMELDEALSRAYADFIVCSERKFEGHIRVQLHRPRLLHAKEVCDSVIPSGEWEFWDDEKLPEKEIRLQWILEQKRPVLAKVSIKGFLEKCPSSMLPLLSLGDAIGTAGRKKERNWMTVQEIRYFARFVRLEIHCVFMAERFEPLYSSKEILELGPMSPMSTVLGLMAECHWMALSARSRHPVTKSKSMVSPRACWLRAADRFLCFSVAMTVAALGYNIISYGAGMITVSVPKEALLQLSQNASDLGLIFPAGVLNQIVNKG